MISHIYSDYQQQGLQVISVQWDSVNKQPVSHREWSGSNLPLRSTDNALMIKTGNGFGALDFDLKNTTKKSIFTEWFNVVSTQRPEILSKVFIEETRNKGYHVWLQYDKFTKKLALADSEDGSEVIALYANGPLVYTYPTPGYSEYHQNMGDIEPLTDDEYNYLLETSQFFNEYKPAYDPTKKAIRYPKGYEKKLIAFDTLLPDDCWHQLLTDIGLQQIRNFKYNKKDHFTAYRRSNSTSDAISAKVYFKTKRVMIFSASMPSFPNWHNKQDYPVWALPPSFVIFYKCNRDWPTALNEIDAIIDSAGIDIEADATVISDSDFPYDIFPDKIRKSLFEVAQARSLAPHFLATAGLWTISSLAGTMYESDFNGDAKNILFALLIAPVSVGKTPAYKSMCETPLSKVMAEADAEYESDIKAWEKEYMESKAEKKAFTKRKPRRYIPFAVDGTTEGYIALNMDQPNGIGVYHDEAETIMNAGSFKANNDSISFFTQAFSGGRLTQIRADRDKERVVPNLNLNLLMGTQPSRLNNVFTQDRLASGFASRFLMVQSDYIQLNTDIDPFAKGKEMCQQWVNLVEALYQLGRIYNTGEADKIKITMDEAAKERYRYYFKLNLQQANERIGNQAEGYIIGTEAKMSAYFPRLCQLIAIIQNFQQPHISEDIIHLGWQLYKYYASSTVKIISQLHGEAETGLKPELELLYQSLPLTFTLKEAEDACIRINLKPTKFKNALRRKDFAALFRRVKQGEYEKV